MKTFIVIQSLLMFAGYLNISAQQGIVSAGGNTSGANGSASSSIGQIFYCSYYGSGGKISEGLQQPLEIYLVTGIWENEDNQPVRAYPNPVKSILLIEMKYTPEKKASYMLYNSNGNVISENMITGNVTSVNMEELPAGVYFIEFFTGSNTVRVFKIIKN
jgi:hypothetical protein